MDLLFPMETTTPPGVHRVCVKESRRMIFLYDIPLSMEVDA